MPATPSIFCDRVWSEFEGEQEPQGGVGRWVNKSDEGCGNNDMVGGDDSYNQPPSIAMSTPLRLLFLAPWSHQVLNNHWFLIAGVFIRGEREGRLRQVYAFAAVPCESINGQERRFPRFP